MAKHDEEDYVGAQWNKSEVSSKPPEVFDAKAQFRPILFQ